jgi:hypothetical protein
MSLTTDEHAWLRRIETKLDDTQANVAKLTAFGCAQAPRHDDHEQRMRVLENAHAQGKGAYKFAHVLSAIIGGAMTFFAGKVWK